MKKPAARADSYARSPDFSERIAGVCFPPEVWAVFAQCDAPRPPAEIARRTRLDEKTVVAALRRLARRHLVQKQQKENLDWNAYLSAQGAPVAEVVPPAAAPPAAVPPPPAPRATPPETPLTFVVANASAAVARRTAAREVLAISLGKSAAQPVVAA